MITIRYTLLSNGKNLDYFNGVSPWTWFFKLDISTFNYRSIIIFGRPKYLGLDQNLLNTGQNTNLSIEKTPFWTRTRNEHISKILETQKKFSTRLKIIFGQAGHISIWVRSNGEVWADSVIAGDHGHWKQVASRTTAWRAWTAQWAKSYKTVWWWKLYIIFVKLQKVHGNWLEKKSSKYYLVPQ